jgi:hypothetical protein
VRSIVLLKGASEETMSEPEDMVLRTTDRSQDRIDGTRRSSSKPTSTLKRDSFRSSMRPSQGVTQRSSSRQTSSRNRSSSRGHNDDRY